MALKHFGTDGIRGEYGSPKLNDAIAYRSGLALARLLAREENAPDCPTLLAGRDTRASGIALLAAVAAGFRAGGGRIFSLGIAPTPAIAKLVDLCGADAGCAVTASHNPSKDNGLKFFQSGGTKLTEKFERELDDEFDVVAESGELDFPEISDTASDRLEMYSAAILSSFPKGMLEGKRIALDCANGSMSSIAPQVFKQLGASIEIVGNNPSGDNINDGVGSECPQTMAKLISYGDFDMGFAFDGDGDRVIAFDQEGSKLAGEATLGILCLEANRRHRLSESVLVTTNQSNLGLESALAAENINTRRVDIGDKFVSRSMIEHGFALGGEESGHIVIGEFSKTGDGLYAALKIAEIVSGSGESLRDLSSFYKPFPIEKRSIPVASKPPLERCPHLRDTISRLDRQLGNDGRLLVRYSGTEPKLRLLVEAKQAEVAASAIRDLEQAVEKDLN